MNFFGRSFEQSLVKSLNCFRQRVVSILRRGKIHVHAHDPENTPSEQGHLRQPLTARVLRVFAIPIYLTYDTVNYPMLSYCIFKDGGSQREQIYLD